MSSEQSNLSGSFVDYGYGTWEAKTYELFSTQYEAGSDFIIGADIELWYNPRITDPPGLAPSNEIRIIQFKRPIQADPHNCTKDGWGIDRHGRDQTPWYGWDDDKDVPSKRSPVTWDVDRETHVRHNKSKLVERAKTAERVAVMNSYAARGNSPRKPYYAQEHEKEEQTRIGKIFSGSRCQSALMWDQPRTQCRLNERTLLFATYAYDVQNSTWLGGVT